LHCVFISKINRQSAVRVFLSTQLASHASRPHRALELALFASVWAIGRLAFLNDAREVGVWYFATIKHDRTNARAIKGGDGDVDVRAAERHLGAFE
jgi:hypothetical protein